MTAGRQHADTIRRAHAKAMEALAADVHPYSASAIRDWEREMDTALDALAADAAAAQPHGGSTLACCEKAYVTPDQWCVWCREEAERARADGLETALREISDPSYVGNYSVEEAVEIYRKFAANALAATVAPSPAELSYETLRARAAGGGVLRRGHDDPEDSVLGRCVHGVDLDREFCPEGCRV